MDRYLKEAIKLELNMAKLYSKFMDWYPEDELFWWQLSNEEKNHASLLENLKAIEIEKEIINYFIDNKLDEMIETNMEIEALIEDYTQSLPKKRIAYKKALNFENRAFEAHYQKIMVNLNTDHDFFSIIKRLNKDDKDHGKRILTLIKEIS